MSSGILNSKVRIGSFGKVLMRYASAQVVSNALRMISGFLVVSLLDPELYGKFTGIGIYMGYILLGHGGIINGLGRELPYALGSGRDEEARRMASSVYVLTVLIGVIAGLGFLGYAIVSFSNGDTLTGWIFLSYVLMGALHLMNQQFLPVLYRTNKDFDSLSRQNIFFGVGNLLTVILVYFIGIYGLLMRGVILAVYNFYLLFKNKPYKLQFASNFSDFKTLFKTGLPIYAVGQVNPLWNTLINNAIFAIGGALNFGLYAISNIILSAVGIIPNAFGQVIYPRMAIALGQGDSTAKILKSNIKPLIFQFAVTLVIAVVGALAIPYIIPILLPKYTDGILAAQWVMFVPAVQSLGALNNIYNVVKKQKWYFVALFSGAVIGSLFILGKLHFSGFSLEIFPQGIIVGSLIQQILAFAFLKKVKNG